MGTLPTSPAGRPGTAVRVSGIAELIGVAPTAITSTEVVYDSPTLGVMW